MSENTDNAPENTDTNWLSEVMNGGLPQLLAGPAGKAISRLIGAGVEIPAAYLDGISQGIRDKTDARSAFYRAVAERAKTQALEDPAIMERAINTMLSRSYRAQLNKDEVAKIAVRDLSENPPQADSLGPTEDWMDRFEKHAEDAANVNLQLLYGKILAGEVRSPGSISLSTLHMVSMLDSQTASLIDRIMPYTLPAGITLLDAIPEKLKVAEVSFIEQSGFFSSDKRYTPQTDDEGNKIEFLGDERYLVMTGKKNAKIEMGNVGFLSFAGKGLFQALRPNFEAKSYSDIAIRSSNIQKVLYGKAIKNSDKIAFPDPIIFENPDFIDN